MDIADLPFITFGGEVAFEDGSMLFLENAFQMSINPNQLESVMKRCGYIPANRIALKSNKLRHELIMAPDGKVDSNFNGIQEVTLIQSIEDQNHAVVNSLVRKGYKLAIELKRKLRCVTRGSQQSNDNGREQVTNFTYPGASSQSSQLQRSIKMSIKEIL